MYRRPFGFSEELFPYIAPGADVDQRFVDQGTPRYSTPQQVHRMVHNCAAIHWSDQKNVRGLVAFLTEVIEKLPARN